MRGFLILDRRAHGTPTPLLEDVMRTLSGRGIEVDWAVIEETALAAGEAPEGYDFHLLKSYTDLGLSLAEMLHRRGERLLNPYPACAVGLPIPRTWSTGDPGLLADRLRDGALIFKPARGVHGAGIRVVRDRRELDAFREEVSARSSLREPLLVQELVPGNGEDLKLYVSGPDVFAVRKAFSETSFQEDGRPCAATDELRDLAARCGRAFGLTL